MLKIDIVNVFHCDKLASQKDGKNIIQWKFEFQTFRMKIVDRNETFDFVRFHCNNVGDE